MKKEILNFGKFSSYSLNCTRKFAFNLAESLNPPYVLYLNGILGSGKTFFCKCVGEYYGIKSINSASFTRVEHNFGEINLSAFLSVCLLTYSLGTSPKEAFDISM